MAHLLPRCPSISKRFYRDSSHKRAGIKQSGSFGKLTDYRRFSWNYGGWRVNENTRSLEKEAVDSIQLCCSSSSTSSAKEVSINGGCEDRKLKFEYLVSEYGWKVRRMVEEEDEMRRVAQVQAEAFHVPAPFFNDFFFQFFQAEVLSGLLYRLRNSPPDRYACLVAEPLNDASEPPQKELVGVVDITVLRDETVLKHLHESEEYLYVSGIAVSKNFRRRKIATVLLKACDMLSILWGFEYLALRAYEDDWGARKLYSNAGYRVVSSDPPWMTSWIGRKRRVLMIKKSNLRDWY